MGEFLWSPSPQVSPGADDIKKVFGHLLLVDISSGKVDMHALWCSGEVPPLAEALFERVNHAQLQNNYGYIHSLWWTVYTYF